MATITIHKAKTQLSKLVDRAAKGEPFVIAEAGKPLPQHFVNRSASYMQVEADMDCALGLAPAEATA